MEISRQDLDRIYKKFICDPDWRVVEALLTQFTEPLTDVRSIDTKGKTADEVFALLEGRKIAIECLDNFLSETKLLSQRMK